MGRKTKPVIAISIETEERKEFGSVFECAHILGVSTTAVLVAVSRGTTVKGWKLYDSPENIRRRIKELKKQIEMLEK